MVTQEFEPFTSPYQVGGGLGFNHPTYVKRQADTELYQGLKQGQFCYVFNARQMGKSSLRLQAMHRLQEEGIACVSLDLTNIGTSDVTSEQWYRGLCFELGRKLRLSKHFSTKTWWEESNHLSPVQRFSRFIEEILNTFEEKLVVICLDEIDSVLGLNFPTDDFFALIRFFYNQRSENPPLDAMIAALKAADTLQKMENSPPLKERSKLLLGRSIAQFSNSEEIPDGSLEELIQNSCNQLENYLESNPNQRIRLEGKMYILEKEDICD